MMMRQAATGGRAQHNRTNDAGRRRGGQCTLALPA